MISMKHNAVYKYLFLAAIGYLTFLNLQLSLRVATTIGGKDEWDAIHPTQQVPPQQQQQQLLSNSVSNSNSNSTLGLSASTECRLSWDLEKKANLTNAWLELELPILISAIRHDRGGEEAHNNARRRLTEEKKKRRRKRKRNPEKNKDFYRNTKDDIVYITFTQRHGRQRKKVMDFKKIPWNCIYGRSATEEGRINGKDADRQGGIVQELAAQINGKPEDIVNLMCNSTMDVNPDSTLVLKGVSPTVLPEQNVTEAIKNEEPFVYDLEAPLECDRLEEQETAAIHEEKKIGACLRFKGDFDRSFVPQWIEYHRLLGIEHFWVYINEEWTLSGLYNQSYITYMPFDLNWDNHKVHFKHWYNDYKPRISQEPASWACMLNARKYGYDWVITTDVDEWIRVPAAENETETDVSVSFPLRSYLERYDPNKYGCFRMKSVGFGRNAWLKPNDYPENPLLIDYVWRQNKSLSEYYSREKGIYNPRSVWSFGVHYCWEAEGEMKELKPENGEAFMQHYKLSHKGVYVKFEKKMVESKNDLVKDSAVRDMFRSGLALAMEKLESSTF